MSAIKSMTGFASAQNHANWGFAVWEVRTVNHRFLDIHFKMPEAWRELEIRMRELVQTKIKRGKVDLQLRYLPGSAVSLELEVNTVLAEQLLNASRVVSKGITHPAPINPVEIIRWPGVVETVESDLDVAFEPVIQVLAEAVDKAVMVREREGEAIQGVMLARIDELDKEVEALKVHLPAILKSHREKIEERLSAFKAELDPTRLEQEIVLFTQKTDIAEELDRLAAHVIEARRVMKTGGAVGRRIDFITQELNREANTIASKSADLKTTQHAIELKVIIEQLREQAQNLE